MRFLPDSSQIPASEITPCDVFVSRRAFIRKAAAASLLSAELFEMTQRQAFAADVTRRKLAAQPHPLYQAKDKWTRYQDATSYNNYYEFGTDKSDPAESAQQFNTQNWQILVDGEVNKPTTLDMTRLLALATLEERVYRLRCVEGWSMVIPWLGYSLSHLIKLVEPNSHARFVEFVSASDPKQMPGVRNPVLQWPYTEGLRLDEAMHPLCLLCLGMYGEILPKQNGAPVRLVVPWKYGFKSAKALVRIRFMREQPRTSWERANPKEYGFYSNVNPHVDHPRWSQASERRIGEDGFFSAKRPTLMFNGYPEVTDLYRGMDLKKYF